MGESVEAVRVLNRLRDAIVIVDSDRRLLWLNSAAAQTFAVQASADRSLLEAVRDHRLDTLMREAIDQGVDASGEIDQLGTGKILRARAMVLPGATAYALVVEDLTEVRHLQTVRQQFVANLSHELRTPLAGLDLAAQTLSNQLEGQSDMRVFADRILEESRRLTAILFNLTQLAALDAEQLRADRLTFSVGELLQENVARFAERATNLGLGLRADLPEEELMALGDRAKTDQTLQSLIDNALKFTNRGEVVLSAAHVDGKVELAVRDTGIGIPAHDLPRIFERFYKVDRARSGQGAGTGLGLSIARRLTELQRGTLTAESTPGVGTTMRLRLPAALAP
jgi:two-component system phosphate regulon sensor histidine kinase PhoR